MVRSWFDVIVVTLDWFEVEMAAIVGVRRNLEGLRRGWLPHRRLGHADLPGWQGHVEGAAGELAVAKLLNRYWSGSINTFKSGGDVGAVQVRTRSRHDYQLIVRDEDRDADWFVLVTGQAPTFHVHGFIRGGDAKRPEWRHDHGGHAPAYFIPQPALRSFPAREAVAC
jgi:hypothetical protein